MMNFNFLKWRNEASLDEAGAPSDLSNVVLPMSLEEAFQHVENVATAAPLWRVEAKDVEAKTIHLSHRTRVFRFVDDVHLRLKAEESGTRIHARSVGRMGSYDFGGNLRNLRDLVRRLRQ